MVSGVCWCSKSSIIAKYSFCRILFCIFQIPLKRKPDRNRKRKCLRLVGSLFFRIAITNGYGLWEATVFFVGESPASSVRIGQAACQALTCNPNPNHNRDPNPNPNPNCNRNPNPNPNPNHIFSKSHFGLDQGFKPTWFDNLRLSPLNIHDSSGFRLWKTYATLVEINFWEHYLHYLLF